MGGGARGSRKAIGGRTAASVATGDAAPPRTRVDWLRTGFGRSPTLPAAAPAPPMAREPAQQHTAAPTCGPFLFDVGNAQGCPLQSTRTHACLLPSLTLSTAFASADGERGGAVVPRVPHRVVHGEFLAEATKSRSAKGPASNLQQTTADSQTMQWG
jgi:hypothetical protein